MEMVDGFLWCICPTFQYASMFYTDLLVRIHGREYFPVRWADKVSRRVYSPDQRGTGVGGRHRQNTEGPTINTITFHILI